jgi:hypothetical protein
VPAEHPSDEIGVVDRVVGGVAVVLVGDDELEYRLDAAALPTGTKEGSWLRLRRSDEGLVVLGLDPSGEAGQRAAMRERLRRLPRGGRFGGKPE